LAENRRHGFRPPLRPSPSTADGAVSNVVVGGLGLEVGPKNVARTAHRLGISSKLDVNASISVGTSEVSLTELVGTYADAKLPYARKWRPSSTDGCSGGRGDLMRHVIHRSSPRKRDPYAAAHRSGLAVNAFYKQQTPVVGFAFARTTRKSYSSTP
jgi:hypothetical protein